MSEFKLIQEILELSSSKVWDHAKLEWSIEEIYDSDVQETCLCGHFPIMEICILKNRTNGNQATVGNTCVKKFIGLSSNRIFLSIKRVKKDIRKSINEEMISYAREKMWITEWEQKFCVDTINKRNLSERQMEIRIKINRLILSKVRIRPSINN